jgi:hypothetical protein
MTKNQIIQQYKNEALNSIAKIYHPKYHFRYDQWSEDSLSEQREDEIRSIIRKMNKNIEETKKKEKEIESKKTNNNEHIRTL